MTLTAKQADRLLDALIAHDLDELAKRLRHAIDRDRRGGTTIADGHRRNRGYDGNTPGSRDLTPTEQAAHDRQRPTIDQHRELTAAATIQARRALAALDRLYGLLEGIDNLTRPDNPTSLEAGCTSCARYRDAIGVEHYSPRFRGDLCQFCYGIVNDTDVNPTRRLPPLTVIARHARGERIPVAVLVDEFKLERIRAKARHN